MKDMFNRIGSYKNYKPTTWVQFTEHEIERYNQKYKKNKNNQFYPEDAIEEEFENQVVDQLYLQYIKQTHMFNLVRHLDINNFYLGDIQHGIACVFNEIINGEVDFSYYDNTREIYEDLIYNEKGVDDITAYDLINQAVKRDNKRFAYYLLYYEDSYLQDIIKDYLRHHVSI